MSAKWRRSKKHLTWLDFKALDLPAKPASKTPHAENFKAARIAHPQKYRLPKHLAKGKYKEPKPLIDMFQDSSYVTIVAQVAGFNQEMVKINIKNQKLTLRAKGKDRRYYKSLNLPKVVIPTVAHTTFKNGVLEIKLKKAMTAKEQTIKQQTRYNDAS
jgi:HSP20 family molecular chaperone IbpA